MKNQEYINKIKLKAENAKISPSEYAWEKLEILLDEEKKSKKIFPVFWIGIAASICFLFSIFYFQNINQSIDNQNITKIDSIEVKENLKQNETKVEDLITQTSIQYQSIEKNKNSIISKTQLENEKKIIVKEVDKNTKNEMVKVNVPKIENQIITNSTQENISQQYELINEIQKVEHKATEQQNDNEQLVESNKVKKRKSYVEQEVLLFSVENELHPVPENHSKKHLEVAKTLIHHLKF